MALICSNLLTISCEYSLSPQRKQTSAQTFTTDAGPTTGGRWINHVAINAPQNGTSTHTVGPDSGSAAAEPHPDFLAALAKNPAAQATYETLSAQNRFAIYFRLHQAKRPETVTRNIEKFIDMLARGETFY